MPLFRFVIVPLTALMVLNGCATGGRSAAQLMPLMNGEVHRLGARIKKQKFDPVPEKSLTNLEMLLQELKTSSPSIYTKDPAVWEQGWTRTWEAFSRLKLAWVSGNGEQITAAFQELIASEDAAHKALLIRAHH